MQFKRGIEVRLTKTPKPAITGEMPLETASVDYVQLVRETTETVAKSLIVGVVAYVAVDTLRQVIVKMTPTN